MNGSNRQAGESGAREIRAVLRGLGCYGQAHDEAAVLSDLHEMIDDLSPIDLCAVRQVVAALLASPPPTRFAEWDSSAWAWAEKKEGVVL
jgi:hypothetical protein